MDTKSDNVINSTLHQVMGREAASGTLVQVVGLEIREWDNRRASEPPARKSGGVREGLSFLKIGKMLVF